MSDNKNIDFHFGLIMIYPELAEHGSVAFRDGTVGLYDEGEGTYIKHWNFDKPQPTVEEIAAATVSEKAKQYLADLEAKFKPKT
jgi:hypothetical protein